MRSAVLLLCFIACGTLCVGSAAADLGSVHTVYLLPMPNGLDQYLANRIAASGVFEVVADPKKADAIFTDRLGQDFEDRLNELSVPSGEKQKTSAADKSDQRPRSSSFGRSKGTIFLVATSSRAVLWSAYQPPKNSTPNELDRIAQRIVERLKPRPKK